MDDLNINSMLGRDSIFNEIVSYIKSFDYNSKNSLFRRGIYIYGKPGIGKTEFVLRLLKKCNINAIICDTTENRNKYIDVSNVNVSTKSICSLFSQVHRSNVLVLDEIELIQALDYTPRKIFENRLWGVCGFIHLCFDIKNMKSLEEACIKAGQPFTVDGGAGFEMGEAAGHFTYIEDADGTLIEFVETKKLPVVKKIGWYLDLRKRDPKKALPNFILKALRFSRVKD